MPDQTRPYRMKARAEAVEATRRRITESAVALHGTLGPARTTMSAVAEHAGVRRSTLYRHFPDEEALFAACSAHWLAANPPPDLAAWGAIEDPGERLATALSELYAYYRGTGEMLVNLLRDEATVPVIAQGLDAFRGYLGAARDLLMAGRRGRRTRALIGHALAFETWRSLTLGQGLDDAEAVAVMAGAVSPSG